MCATSDQYDAFEVTATPAAGLPDDISKMPFRPKPVELPAFA